MLETDVFGDCTALKKDKPLKRQVFRVHVKPSADDEAGLKLAEQHSNANNSRRSTIKSMPIRFMEASNRFTLFATSNRVYFAGKLMFDFYTIYSSDNTMKEVTQLRNCDSPIKQLGAADCHFLVLTHSGKVYFTGCCNTSSEQQQQQQQMVKFVVPELFNQHLVNLFASFPVGYSAPSHSESLEYIKDVSCGSYHSSFITRNGNWYLMGLKINDQTSLAFISKESIPERRVEYTRVPEHWVKSTSGDMHTIAMTSENRLFRIEKGGNGELKEVNVCLVPSMPSTFYDSEHVNYVFNSSNNPMVRQLSSAGTHDFVTTCTIPLFLEEDYDYTMDKHIKSTLLTDLKAGNLCNVTLKFYE